jgi:hypothetical protein
MPSPLHFFPCRTERARQWCTAGQGLPAYTVPSSPSICSRSGSVVKPCPRDSWATRRLPFDPFTLPFIANSCKSARMWRAKQARLSHRVDRVGSLSLRVNCFLPTAQLTCRRRQVSSSRKSPPTVFSRMRTNRIRHAISLSPTGGVYNAILAGVLLLYPHRRVGRCNVPTQRQESNSRCSSRAIEERMLRIQSASSSHFS